MAYFKSIALWSVQSFKAKPSTSTIIPKRNRYYWEARPECRERKRLMMITLPRLPKRKPLETPEKLQEPKMHGLDVILHQEVQEIINTSRMVVACLHANQMEDEYYRVRYELKQHEMSMEKYDRHVVEFTLKDTPYEHLLTLFEDPCIVIHGEPNAKQMLTAVKKNKNLLLLGGMIDGKLMSSPELINFANLQSLDHSRGELCGILSSVSSSTYNLLNKPTSSLVTSLRQYMDDNEVRTGTGSESDD